MRNKLLVLAGVLSILFSMAACGNAENGVTQETGTSSVVVSEEATKTITSEHEHNYISKVTKEPTCEADGQGEITYTCSICADTYTEETDRIDHCTDDVKVIQEATCSKVGIKTYSCIFCGREFEREELPKLAHTESDWIITVEPTSTSKGSRHKVCTVCGEEVAG